jgi:hypothetical protein
MILVIQTQDQENYGSHDWDGIDACPQHWKMKGGNEIKITNVPALIDYAEVVELVRDDIETDNQFFRTTIMSWSIENDDYLSWFEQSQLDTDGRIQFKEPTIEYGEVMDSFA